jgi:hypothetical protein
MFSSYRFVGKLRTFYENDGTHTSESESWKKELVFQSGLFRAPPAADASPERSDRLTPKVNLPDPSDPDLHTSDDEMKLCLTLN